MYEFSKQYSMDQHGVVREYVNLEPAAVQELLERTMGPSSTGEACNEDISHTRPCCSVYVRSVFGWLGRGTEFN